MRCVEPPRRLIATEFRQEMSDGESRPLLISAFPEDWSRPEEVVLKLRDPQVSVSQHGGTGLACELICSMLARALGFSVPNYFLVDVSADFADAVSNRDAAQRLRNNIGLNFGTGYIKSARTWGGGRRSLPQDLAQFFSDLLDFDSILVNGDRGIGNTNVLWDGRSCFPIDHAFTLDPCRRSAGRYAEFLEEPVLADEVVKVHVSKELLHWRERPDSRTLARWNEYPMGDILSEIRAELPLEWETNGGDFDRIFDLLHQREQHFELISDQLRRLVS